MLKSAVCKLIQRQTYTCLSHKYGIYFAYTGLVVVLYSMFHFGEELLEWSQHKYDITFSAYHDNIASRSFQHKLCSQFPIDVVYTWVNGSDPELIAQLNSLKLDIGFNSSKSKNNKTDYSCNLKNCVQLPLVILKSKAPKELYDKDDKIASIFDFKIAKDVVGTTAVNASVIRYKDLKSAKSAHTANGTTFLFYVTTDQTAQYSMKLNKSLLIESIPNKIKSVDELQKLLPDKIKEKLDWMYLDVGKNLAFLWLQDSELVDDIANDKSNSTLKTGIKIDGESVKVHECYLVGLTQSATGDDEVSRSRFEDNEELRYSLRSVEKYAPWVRHIYIVTNGQIPYWLNMDSKRITVVTHEEIFVNKSHLPTFSSPAIEAHIHRIPGLAERFIYFNDDVMFGREVWPEDFYTETAGHKIYLAWVVPNCADGCSPSWITDGYCDSACNVSECNWDGGDCTGDNIKMGVGMNSNFGNQPWSSSISSYCKPGCSNNWIADKFCDQACNVEECGFDAGDCGISSFSKVFKLTSNLKNGSAYNLPWGKYLTYIDLTKTFSKVTAASYEQTDNLRTAAVSNKFHVLTILFAQNGNETTVNFNVTGLSAQNLTKGDNETHQEVQFTFSVSAFPSSNETNTTLSPHEDEIEPTETTIQIDEESYDPVFIAVPDDKKAPKINEHQPVKLPEMHFDVELVNKSKLPQKIQSDLENLKGDLEDGYLTETGYLKSVYELLRPFFDVLDKIHLESDQTPIMKNSIISKQDSKELFHARGDPGEIIVNQSTHPPHLFRKENLAFLEQKSSSENRSLQHNNEDKVNTRKLLSLDTAWTNDDTGFLPWEKDPALTDFVNRLVENQQRNQEYSTNFKHRKLLDTFGESLRFVSGLYNRRFGFKQRKVPAHMPHFIHKSIMTELQSYYPAEYDQTSSHRLRHPQDMQFAFSYFYYVMSEEKPINYSEIFDRLDTDESGVLSDRELRLLATQLYELPLTLQELTGLESYIKDCAWELYGTGTKNDSKSDNSTTQSYTQPLDDIEEWATTEKYYDKSMPLVTKEIILNCKPLLELFNKTFGGEKLFKHQIMEHGDVAFKMIRSNVSTVVGQLDDIRKNPKKFICLNDNIDHNLEQASTVKAVVRDFYETLFPSQSQFELPHEYRNRFSNLRELRSWQEEHRRTLQMMHGVLAFLIFCVIVSFFWDQIYKVWRKYRPLIRRRRFPWFRGRVRNPV
uniref:N-acetylglucosamine-1-phosphotransferase subunits alpha/beta n=1 Tax=Phallusia mammillata TaxID=59560 RepID=A0A6F9DEF5_9ASCI|nr:N-acetylglucosamine-1-phosphotransferase subunits alpha/beta [Phallusia mammillata]